MKLFSGMLGNASAITADDLYEKYEKLLVENEQIDAGFVVIRDTFIFTNKRLILVDKQGMTGKKTAYLSVPYSKITKFSIETAGHLDLDAELKIWVGSDSEPIAKKFNKKVDIYELQQVLANHCL